MQNVTRYTEDERQPMFHRLGVVRACLFAAAIMLPGSAFSQSALDAASQLAGNADALTFESGVAVGLSSDAMLDVLEEAANDGDPQALWRLGVMYEGGIGVTQDPVKAFGYFAKIANENADTPPRSLEADIVARSFVKIGDYYKIGLPDAGISANAQQSKALLEHAASYFGDPDAQYRLGLLYLDDGTEQSPFQGARWLSLAAHKGHLGAQAVLGNLLFNGADGIAPQPVNGLMWLSLAQEGARGSEEEVWVSELATRAMSIASPEQRLQATDAANSIRSQISRY